MGKNVVIKLGSAENINSMIGLGDHWAEDFEIEDYDHDQWTEIVRAYSIYTDHRSLVFYNNLNKPAGFLLGCITKIPHNGKMVAQIHYMYLLPDFFNHENLYELHREFQEWAQGFQAQEITAPDFYPLPDEYQEFFKDLEYKTGLPTQIKGLA